MNLHPKTCLMVLDNSYHPDHRPRREIQTLVADGWCVVVLCEEGDDLPKQEVHGNVEIHRIKGPWRGGVVAICGGKQVDQTIAFVQSKWPQGFQVVHCHDWLTLPFGQKLAKAIGARLVYDAHEYFAGVAKGRKEGFRARMRHWLRLWREGRALTYVDMLVTVSPLIATWFVERRGFSKPIVVLYNMPDWDVETKADAELRARFGIPGSALLLVHAGNIRFNTRRVDVVVQSMSEMPNCHLLCVGTGEDAKLMALANEAGIADRVHHLPAVAYQKLGGVLAACDIGLSVLQPGVLNHEAALPNKLFEYLSAGLPVLGSPVAEQRQFLQRERIGWTMTELSPRACAEALRCASENLSATRERVCKHRSHYVWSSQNKVLVNAYANLLK